MKEGDVVVAPFHFMDAEDQKLRPCLVLSVDAVSAELVFITSQKLAKAFESEVVLPYEEARLIGLDRASRIDFAKRDRLPRCKVKRVLGTIYALPKSRLAEMFRAARAAGLYDE